MGSENRLMRHDPTWKHQLRQGTEDLSGDLEKVWSGTLSRGNFSRQGIGEEPCD